MDKNISRKSRASQIMNAAGSMPVEEVVRFIEHGKSMVDYIRGECKECRQSSFPSKSQCALCDTGKVIKFMGQVK